MDYLWLFAVAEGAAALGLAIALGTIRRDRVRRRFAACIAMIVPAIAVGIAWLVSMSAAVPSDPTGTAGSHYGLPAGQSREN
jgi:ABC-type spermidine/putrescine transport system permease subunit II